MEQGVGIDRVHITQIYGTSVNRSRLEIADVGSTYAATVIQLPFSEDFQRLSEDEDSATADFTWHHSTHGVRSWAWKPAHPACWVIGRVRDACKRVAFFFRVGFDEGAGVSQGGQHEVPFVWRGWWWGGRRVGRRGGWVNGGEGTGD